MYYQYIQCIVKLYFLILANYRVLRRHPKNLCLWYSISFIQYSVLTYTAWGPLNNPAFIINIFWIKSRNFVKVRTEHCSGTPLMWRPLGPSQSVLIRGYHYFRGCFIRDHTQCLQYSGCPYLLTCTCISQQFDMYMYYPTVWHVLANSINELTVQQHQ